MQMCCCAFNIIIFILSCSYFSRQYPASMHLFKVAIRKFIPPLIVLVFLIVDSQIPLSILAKPMLRNELILLLCRRLVLAPHIPLIKDIVSFLYQLLCMFKCSSVQFDCHRSHLLLCCSPVYSAAICSCRMRKYDQPLLWLCACSTCWT